MRFAFTRTGPLEGVGALFFNDQAVGTLELSEMMPDFRATRSAELRV